MHTSFLPITITAETGCCQSLFLPILTFWKKYRILVQKRRRLPYEQTEQIHAGGKPYYGTALLLLAYMLAKIVQAYIVGSTDAPSVKVLLLGIVVLGGGIVFVVRYLVLLLKEYYRKPEDSSEKEQ